MRAYRLATICVLCALLAFPSAAYPEGGGPDRPVVNAEISSAVSAQVLAYNTLISDAEFEASTCLRAADVQRFLEAYGGVLDTLVVPDHTGVRKSAAQIICDAAVAYRISPRVLLAKLQCEQSLLEAPNPTSTQLDWAMGCGVPDTGAKNDAYKGFGNQVWFAAQKFDSYRPEWTPGISKWCYDGTVYPSNRSTWALYRYTPWISSNQLFTKVYRRYFGDSNMTAPGVPAHVYRRVPITVTGFIDAHAATGQIKLLFYQKFGDTWRLQKTEYARYSGVSPYTTAYVADTTIPYAGTWRIGASFSGNPTHIAAYEYRDFTVAVPSAGMTVPGVPRQVYRNKPITVTGFISKAAATSQIRLLYYQKIGDTWKLQMTRYARWSGYNSSTTAFVDDVTIPYAGTWRVGASYIGNAVYPAAYTYRDFVVAMP